ncbi:MAG TPA: enoyl-CoA hydratase/isomerase family protein [Pyrinomonadaceae bacterium]|nr:enoyl-CoA hydratase/isomerase family protein [Acidobacteriota bacterium]HQZ96653.1 enoyl-CoA hydratase/isomerase family protein [Pyrinomonadaceae bacterium]
MENSSDALQIERIGSFCIVRFTRPEIRNPLSLTVLDQIHLALDDLHLYEELETLVFTGSQLSFASGADLREIAAVTAENAVGFARYGQETMVRIAVLEMRTVAAINGFCFGGALDLALACDVRVASPNAKFAHPGAGLGIITGWGGTQRLPRLIGQTNALEMFFTAEAIDAERALHIGLVDLVTDDIFRNELLNVL